MPGHKDWINKAFNDLKASKKLVQGDDETLDIAAYHAHQCVEKSLKALFMYRRETVPKSHDLEFLLEKCVEQDLFIMALKKKILSLSPYEMRTRYPDDRFFVDRSDAIEAIEIAELVLKTVAKFLYITI